MLENLERFSTTAGAYAFVVLLGLLWGSFANVCIYRWPPSDDADLGPVEFPNGRSVITPGSHCFACKQPIKWYDNVPLLAWLWLRGKCRSCKAAFSSRYLIVEALTGVLFGSPGGSPSRTRCGSGASRSRPSSSGSESTRRFASSWW
jgi:leader peptidase (prepilin peptidase)/N-methyltransferase